MNNKELLEMYLNKLSSFIKPFLKYGFIDPIKDDKEYQEILNKLIEYSINYPFLTFKEYYTMMKYSRMLEFYDENK